MERDSEILAAIAAALDEVAGERSALDLVGEIPMVEAAVEQVIAERVAAARAEGLSWHAIAQQLGTSRQAAHKRFGKGAAPRTRKGSGMRLELKLDRPGKAK